MKVLSIFPKVILIVVTVLLINGCEKNDDIPTYDLTGDWKVISFENYETSTKITKTEDNTWPQFNAGENTVSFIKSSPTGGIINGINVTNSFSADYTIDQRGSIDINGGIWTKINEPEWGKLFHSIVEVDTYEIRKDRLILYYNHKRNSITLERYYNTPTIDV